MRAFPASLLRHSYAQLRVANNKRGKLSSAATRRAISTAYYAVFHGISVKAAEVILGQQAVAGSTRRGELGLISRHVEHSNLLRASKKLANVIESVIKAEEQNPVRKKRTYRNTTDVNTIPSALGTSISKGSSDAGFPALNNEALHQQLIKIQTADLDSLLTVSKNFQKLQNDRHLADYDLTIPFSESDAYQRITLAHQTLYLIGAFDIENVDGEVAYNELHRPSTEALDLFLRMLLFSTPRTL